MIPKTKYEAKEDGVYKTWYNPKCNEECCEKMANEEIVAELEGIEQAYNTAVANLTTARQQVEVLDAFKNGVETVVDIMKRVGY